MDHFPYNQKDSGCMHALRVALKYPEKNIGGILRPPQVGSPQQAGIGTDVGGNIVCLSRLVIGANCLLSEVAGQ